MRGDVIGASVCDLACGTGRHAVDVSCTARGIEHRLFPPRNPQTNGLVERFNARIGDLAEQTRFASASELEATLAL